MKNVVIAAGYATRLGELTKNFPKPLLKIGEKSILDRMLEDIDTIVTDRKPSEKWVNICAEKNIELFCGKDVL